MAFETDKHLAAEGTTGPVELSAALTAAEELRKGGFLLKKRAGFRSGGGWRSSAALPSRVVQSGRLRGRPARPETLPWQLARREEEEEEEEEPSAFSARLPANAGEGRGKLWGGAAPAQAREHGPSPASRPERGCSRDSSPPLLASGPCLRKEPPNCASSPGRRRRPATGSPALAGSSPDRFSESGAGEGMAASAPLPPPSAFPPGPGRPLEAGGPRLRRWEGSGGTRCCRCQSRQRRESSALRRPPCRRAAAGSSQSRF